MIDSKLFSFKKQTFQSSSSDSQAIGDIAIGYFDEVLVKNIGVSSSDIMTGLSAYYKTISTQEFRSNGQNIYAFANIVDKSEEEKNKDLGKEKNKHSETVAYDSKKLNDFWRDFEALRFYSLLHISYTDKPSICEIVKAILKKFNGKEHPDKYHAVCYFSFDYSDIIICAKDMTFGSFVKKIFSINYFSTNKEPHIKDSFSIAVVKKEIVLNMQNLLHIESLPKYEDMRKELSDNNQFSCFINSYCNEIFSIAYNIGVTDYTQLIMLTDKLKDMGIAHELQHMLGRHDATIYVAEGNLLHLLIIQTLIGLCSTNGKNLLYNQEAYVRFSGNESERKVFSTPLQNNKGEDNESADGLNKTASQPIILSSNKETIKDLNIDSLFKTALSTLDDGIKRISTTGFANDFIACIYEPFIRFIQHIEQVTKNTTNSSQIQECFSEFFDIIDSIVSSTMHSERQFIQVPAFQHVLFDIPPKLLAFYMAATDMIVEINRDFDEKNLYSFAFKPKLSSTIYVKIFSSPATPPTDRLLSVSINEKALYQPQTVLTVMCHEIAHYVGQSQRCREERRECFVKSILYYSVDLILSNSMYAEKICGDSTYDSLIAKFVSLAYKAIMDSDNSLEKYKYAEVFPKLIANVFIDFLSDKIIPRIFLSVFMKTKNAEYFNIQMAFNDIVSYMERFIQEIPESVEDTAQLPSWIDNNFFVFYQTMLSVYSEIYADIKMISVMKISLETYLQSFVDSYNINVETLKTDEKLHYRIFCVAFTMYIFKKENWDILDTGNMEEELKQILQYIKDSAVKLVNTVDLNLIYDNIGEQRINILASQNNDFSEEDGLIPYVNANILIYLKNVVESNNEKVSEEKINLFQEMLMGIKSSDALEVFYTIQKTNKSYLKKLEQSEKSEN